MTVQAIVELICNIVASRLGIPEDQIEPTTQLSQLQEWTQTDYEELGMCLEFGFGLSIGGVSGEVMQAYDSPQAYVGWLSEHAPDLSVLVWNDKYYAPETPPSGEDSFEF